MTVFPKLQLIYFNLRALAEAPQMMLHYANVPYSYEMAWDYYEKPWEEAKLDIPFQLLPLLIVNNSIKIWESGAIIRYLAKITNTLPNDNLLVAQVDSIFESSKGLIRPLNPLVNIMIGERHNENKKVFFKSFPKTLKNFVIQLEKNPDGPFFFGSRPYFCDFSVYHHFSLVKLLDNEIFNEFESILNFMSSFENLPGIKKYINNRPKIIDIGKAPKFLINGIKVPSGTDPLKEYS